MEDIHKLSLITEIREFISFLSIYDSNDNENYTKLVLIKELNECCFTVKHYISSYETIDIKYFYSDFNNKNKKAMTEYSNFLLSILDKICNDIQIPNYINFSIDLIKYYKSDIATSENLNKYKQKQQLQISEIVKYNKILKFEILNQHLINFIYILYVFYSNNYIFCINIKDALALINLNGKKYYEDINQALIKKFKISKYEYISDKTYLISKTRFSSILDDNKNLSSLIFKHNQKMFYYLISKKAHCKNYSRMTSVIKSVLCFCKLTKIYNEKKTFKKCNYLLMELIVQQYNIPLEYQIYSDESVKRKDNIGDFLRFENENQGILSSLIVDEDKPEERDCLISSLIEKANNEKYNKYLSGHLNSNLIVQTKDELLIDCYQNVKLKNYSLKVFFDFEENKNLLIMLPKLHSYLSYLSRCWKEYVDDLNYLYYNQNNFSISVASVIIQRINQIKAMIILFNINYYFLNLNTIKGYLRSQFFKTIIDDICLLKDLAKQIVEYMDELGLLNLLISHSIGEWVKAKKTGIKSMGNILFAYMKKSKGKNKTSDDIKVKNFVEVLNDYELINLAEKYELKEISEIIKQRIVQSEKKGVVLKISLGLINDIICNLDLSFSKIIKKMYDNLFKQPNNDDDKENDNKTKKKKSIVDLIGVNIKENENESIVQSFYKGFVNLKKNKKRDTLNNSIGNISARQELSNSFNYNNNISNNNNSINVSNLNNDIVNLMETADITYLLKVAYKLRKHVIKINEARINSVLSFLLKNSDKVADMETLRNNLSIRNFDIESYILYIIFLGKISKINRSLIKSPFLDNSSKNIRELSAIESLTIGSPIQKLNDINTKRMISIDEEDDDENLLIETPTGQDKLIKNYLLSDSMCDVNTTSIISGNIKNNSASKLIIFNNENNNHINGNFNILLENFNKSNQNLHNRSLSSDVKLKNTISTIGNGNKESEILSKRTISSSYIKMQASHSHSMNKRELSDEPKPQKLNISINKNTYQHYSNNNNNNINNNKITNNKIKSENLNSSEYGLNKKGRIYDKLQKLSINLEKNSESIKKSDTLNLSSINSGGNNSTYTKGFFLKRTSKEFNKERDNSINVEDNDKNTKELSDKYVKNCIKSIGLIDYDLEKIKKKLKSLSTCDKSVSDSVKLQINELNYNFTSVSIENNDKNDFDEDRSINSKDDKPEIEIFNAFENLEKRLNTKVPWDVENTYAGEDINILINRYELDINNNFYENIYDSLNDIKNKINSL